MVYGGVVVWISGFWVVDCLFGGIIPWLSEEYIALLRVGFLSLSSHGRPLSKAHLLMLSTEVSKLSIRQGYRDDSRILIL